MEMNYSFMTKIMFLLAIAIILISFSGCRTTGGGVALEWGQENGYGHHHKVKKGGPPPHAPAHGYRAKYKYRYYPSCNVYYDAYRKLYFYLEGPDWHISASLPHAIQVGLGDYVSIEIDADKPYIYNKEHKHRYPPGQYKKKFKKKS
jgi:hypothetical protein